ncbi:MAG: ABC transporter permease [Candidatus Parvarchaeota archaeon]
MLSDHYLRVKKILGGPRANSFKVTLQMLFSRPTSAFGMLIVILYIAIAIIDQVHPELFGIHGDIGTLVPNFLHPVPLPPSRKYPLGTTYPGINLLTGIIKAIRIDVAVSFFIVLVGAALGMLLGVYAAFRGGIFDEIIMRLTDIVFSLPFLVIVIAAGFFIPDGRSFKILVIILIIVWWPTYARVARGQALSIKNLSYVEAAKACGVSSTKTIFKHILPNTMAPVLVQISLDVGTVMLLMASLAFLGFLPAGGYFAELGYLVNIGIPYFIDGYWWTMVFPSLTIMLWALSVNMIGDGLRDALDPKLRR